MHDEAKKCEIKIEDIIRGGREKVQYDIGRQRSASM